MYGQLLLKALSDKYNAQISDAMAGLNMCLGGIHHSKRRHPHPRLTTKTQRVANE